MPTVNVGRDLLFEALGKEYTEEEFEELCFEYGIELDEVTSEKQMASRMAGKECDDDGDEEVIYKIDIPANRYDMLCLEGIANALNVFLGRTPVPKYRLVEPPNGQPRQRMVVKPETMLVRPFVVCAVLRGVKFDQARYNSFIDLQDKLHQNLCRRRTLVAIGTHDLSTLQGPFSYEARVPEDIEFVPLKQTQSFNARDLMEHYKSDLKLRAFLPIIEKSLVYPVIYDAKGTVLSLPPIINGSHSAINLNTQDVFIECTATDLNKASITLNTVVTMFSMYSKEPFTVEPVEVEDALGNVNVYPKLDSRALSVELDYINSRIGTNLDAATAAKLLSKMCLSGAVGKDGKSIDVLVPPTRSDILHPCDVMEDVAIAYGYNNIVERVPSTVTEARALPINHLTDLLRSDIAMAGFTEVLTWILGSIQDNFEFVNRPDDLKKAAQISNAKTIDFQVVRTSLIPGLLKTLGSNKDAPLPVKIFEISDCVELDTTKDVGARNIRRVAGLACGTTSSFEVVHGLLDRIMEVLGVPFGGDAGYSLDPTGANEDGAFFPGRAANIMWKGKKVGSFGVVHPEVLTRFGIINPCSVVEVDLENFLAMPL
mmetsp:Transcript_40339/g.48887  ORF Transcript_40339/g.48887 Transcript_40339/m.48887 type:complete len:598 (-) Transcript_40339:268-2061(-)|eukprot:CAMPEP_0197863748 /NCGR_PEP_ID=MMETSP1438-20131217/41444_1 /TAXON_ID=1461541 /ORGANISM="Pterosperma sp., Strain CCMP1384" /LENGTH=597 /DNA_ID=CAMNT_0043481763 /DNA_START=58 /DNA_END=1851 /DNA_ORIENTATION=+